jgi:hypothetical protein
MFDSMNYAPEIITGGATFYIARRTWKILAETSSIFLFLVSVWAFLAKGNRLNLSLAVIVVISLLTLNGCATSSVDFDARENTAEKMEDTLEVPTDNGVVIATLPRPAPIVQTTTGKSYCSNQLLKARVLRTPQDILEYKKCVRGAVPSHFFVNPFNVYRKIDVKPGD